jgi:hypothetical protein
MIDDSGSNEITARKRAVGSRTDVFVVDDFLSVDECAAFIALSEGRGFDQATVGTAAGQVVAQDIRNNDRLIWDDPGLAQRWWQRARELFPPAFGQWHACGLNERFRFYRYRPGQKFAQHRDGSFERSPTEISWMTLMVYLNDDYTGGRTRFDLVGEPEPIAIRPATGMALAFMHDRLHEGEAVSSGIKYVLRTDVMYRRG